MAGTFGPACGPEQVDRRRRRRHLPRRHTGFGANGCRAGDARRDVCVEASPLGRGPGTRGPRRCAGRARRLQCLARPRTHVAGFGPRPAHPGHGASWPGRRPGASPRARRTVGQAMITARLRVAYVPVCRARARYGRRMAGTVTCRDEALRSPCIGPPRRPHLIGHDMLRSMPPVTSSRAAVRFSRHTGPGLDRSPAPVTPVRGSDGAPGPGSPPPRPRRRAGGSSPPASFPPVAR